MSNQNIYIPYLMRIEKITLEVPGVKAFRVKFENEEDAETVSFNAWQFDEYSLGVGESTFCIASLPARKGYIECTFRQTGKVTSVLAEKGDVVGFRGRYGNTFPLNKWKGKNLLFRAGGIALTAKGFVIRDAHDTHEKFKAIIIIYGAKSGEDLVYKDEIAEWRSCLDLKLVTTVDPGGETPD